MTMTVLSLMASPGPDIYHTATWRRLVETHLIYLRRLRASDVVVIEPHVAYKYEGDFFGALTDLNIPQYMHWTIMRVNGLYSPAEFKGEAVTLMVPSKETFQQLAAIAATTQKKIT